MQYIVLDNDILVIEHEELRDLLEDIMERIQEFREEMLGELDDLEDMVVETSGIKIH